MFDDNKLQSNKLLDMFARNDNLSQKLKTK